MPSGNPTLSGAGATDAQARGTRPAAGIQTEVDVEAGRRGGGGVNALGGVSRGEMGSSNQGTPGIEHEHGSSQRFRDGCETKSDFVSLGIGISSRLRRTAKYAQYSGRHEVNTCLARFYARFGHCFIDFRDAFRCDYARIMVAQRPIHWITSNRPRNGGEPASRPGPPFPICAHPVR